MMRDAYTLNMEKDTLWRIFNDIFNGPFQGVLAVLVFINGDCRDCAVVLRGPSHSSCRHVRDLVPKKPASQANYITHELIMSLSLTPKTKIDCVVFLLFGSATSEKKQ